MGIPRTKHGHDPFWCISAMQKCIRRSLEREAMEYAAELLASSKAFCTMACNRLQVISHEDIDCIHNPEVVTFVATACEQARAMWKEDFVWTSLMFVGNAIRMMARAQKSREGDHFQAAVGLPIVEGMRKLEFPDWAHDMHTSKGKKLGRGLDHFREVATQLVPDVEGDEYEDEAYANWHTQKRRAAD
jgi:replication-associated recombination protein RarA